MDAVAIASTDQMYNDKELRDDSDNDSPTGEPEDNGNDAIDVEEDQDNYDDSIYSPVMVFKKY